MHNIHPSEHLGLCRTRVLLLLAPSLHTEKELTSTSPPAPAWQVLSLLLYVSEWLLSFCGSSLFSEIHAVSWVPLCRLLSLIHACLLVLSGIDPLK